ncbi:MAG: glycerol-3-phosphate dehydrogenase/oxidase [Bryobacteraceae bacterium]
MHSARPAQIEALRSSALDTLIVGGGINGAGTLRDLAGRAGQAGAPLRFGLIEKNHFASGTSGKNSQLIHGGLRYLKYLNFGLVRESLRERSTLLRIAPQYVRPLPFLLPMYGWKSRLIYGAGLSMYDLLSGGHSIQKHRVVSDSEVAGIEPGLNRAGLTASAIFYDCRVHSARLVLANIIDAMDRGALAVNYLKAEQWTRKGERWRIRVRDTLSQELFDIEARKVIDATGAWSGGASLRLVRGSHIIIPRVNASENAISYFERSGRIVFLIPWGTNHQLTLVGTTDVDHSTGPDRVRITQEEVEYLLGIVQQVFPAKSQRDVISSYSSLRPLVGHGSNSPTSASRGHRIWNSAEGILHIAGGKYTTYRAMSEEAADLACREIAPDLAASHWTEKIALPDPDEAREIELEQRLSDHLFVSTYLGYERRWDPEALRPYAESMAARLEWGGQRIEAELRDGMGEFSPVASV